MSISAIKRSLSEMDRGFIRFFIDFLQQLRDAYLGLSRVSIMKAFL